MSRYLIRWSWMLWLGLGVLPVQAGGSLPVDLATTGTWNVSGAASCSAGSLGKDKESGTLSLVFDEVQKTVDLTFFSEDMEELTLNLPANTSASSIVLTEADCDPDILEDLAMDVVVGGIGDDIDADEIELTSAPVLKVVLGVKGRGSVDSLSADLTVAISLKVEATVTYEQWVGSEEDGDYVEKTKQVKGGYTFKGKISKDLFTYDGSEWDVTGQYKLSCGGAGEKGPLQMTLTMEEKTDAIEPAVFQLLDGEDEGFTGTYVSKSLQPNKQAYTLCPELSEDEEFIVNQLELLAEEEDVYLDSVEFTGSACTAVIATNAKTQQTTLTLQIKITFTCSVEVDTDDDLVTRAYKGTYTYAGKAVS